MAGIHVKFRPIFLLATILRTVQEHIENILELRPSPTELCPGAMKSILAISLAVAGALAQGITQLPFCAV